VQDWHCRIGSAGLAVQVPQVPEIWYTYARPSPDPTRPHLPHGTLCLRPRLYDRGTPMSSPGCPGCPDGAGRLWKALEALVRVFACLALGSLGSTLIAVPGASCCVLAASGWPGLAWSWLGPDGLALVQLGTARAVSWLGILMRLMPDAPDAPGAWLFLSCSILFMLFCSILFLS